MSAASLPVDYATKYLPLAMFYEFFETTSIEYIYYNPSPYTSLCVLIFYLSMTINLLHFVSPIYSKN